MHFPTSLPLLSLLILSLLALSSTVSAQPASNANSLLSKRTPSGSSPLKARAPAPSRRMGKRAAAQAALGPTKKDYSAFLCPDKAVACPIAKPGSLLADVKQAELVTLKDWFKAGFECLDTKEELGSCGGCSSLGKGQDCTLIPNARNVGCEAGKCSVQSCKEGFVVGRDGKSCIRRGLTRR